MNVLRHLLPLTLSLGILPVLSAQRGNEGTGERGAEGTAEAQKAAEADEAARAAGESVTGDGAMSPAYLTNLVHGTVALRPRRLAPGESGVVAVLLILQNPAVVLADAAISLEYAAQQGDLELGPFQVQPAVAGTLPTRFLGTPVFDNSVTIEVPVTVGKTAAHGDVRLSFHAKVPLTDGSNGNPMGEGQIPIQGSVRIGRPLPRPNIATGSAGSGVAAIGLDPVDDDEPDVVPVPVAAPTAAPRETPVAMMFHTESAADVDRLVFAIDLPSPTHLRLGGSCAGRARIEVPSGQWLFRGEGSALRIDVDGVGAGVSASIDDLPAGAARDIGGKAVAVSDGVLTIPLTLAAEPEAEVGIRQLAFQLTYQTIGADGVPSAPRVLTVPAVLPVGMGLTTATPWPFYAAGAVLAVLLIALIARGMRK